MKLRRLSHRLVLALSTALFSIANASGITFSSNTLISAGNTNFDGADIVVTNCTVTIDGAHSFASFQINQAGVLTHSFNASGVLFTLTPVIGELHVLNATDPVVLNGTNVVDGSVVVTDTSGLVVYTNGVDYILTGSGVVSLQRADTSAIPDGASVLVSYTISNNVPTGLNLAITGDFSVNVGGAVNANAAGYGGTMGPGAGHSASGSVQDGSGAGYGGYGGMSSSNAPGGTVYDSAYHPADKGSGGGLGLGGPGGIGGGLVSLTVGGKLSANGSITAVGQDATNSRSGGGSGGGIYLSAQTFAGSGQVTADGGTGEPIHGGGGGGGRIAIYASTNLYNGTVSARGGIGFMTGGAGTLYTRSGNTPAPLLTLDNGNRSGTNTLVQVVDSSDLVVQGGAIATLAAPQTVGNLVISSNSWMVGLAAQSTLSLQATGNVTLQPGGGIRADGNGFPGGVGPGPGQSTNAGGTLGYIGSGGGFGGTGGAGGLGPRGGYSYGNIPAVGGPGSGGGSGGGLTGPRPGGAGGGSISLSVSGSLTVDGSISANGNPSPFLNGGGGSGGSISVQAGALRGSGGISAAGGAGIGLGGGGGGGRISLIYSTNVFGGSAAAYGGGGANSGGAGTVTFAVFNPVGANSIQRVVVDNGGRPGALSSLGSVSSFSLGDLSVTGGASLAWPSISPALGSLLVTSNAWLYVTNPVSTLITVNSNATIQAGGSIILDGAGYPFSQGLGSGKSAGGTGFGAGGGAYGGNGATGGGGSPYAGVGGTGYGSVPESNDRGSSGGNGYAGTPSASGGIGGGALRLSVSRTLQLDGLISANGLPGSGTNAGGGSGGGLSLTALTFTGSGTLRANGGNGITLGGGGGGGRIAVNSQTNLFLGAMTAYGGGGSSYGGAGTIYLTGPVGGKPVATLLIIDNGGRSGTTTSLGTTQIGTIDLTLQNGASLGLKTPQTFGSLVINSNSWLFISNTVPLLVSVRNNAQVQSGGGIIADAGGYGAGFGQGAGRSASSSQSGGSGGGYGGYGAPTTVPGGNAFGVATSGQPAAGSGGGNPYSSQGTGGVGGGIVQLSVIGSLQLDGRISADGGPALALQAGGGSGGGIALTVGGLSGSGVISASGGPGGGLGGGGGGGRIYINYHSNLFAGTIKATGAGNGTNFGGAGTIFTQRFDKQSALLLVDNGGLLGANTLLIDASGAFDLSIQGGAILVASSQGPSFNNLQIATNSWWLATNNSILTVHGDATLRAGGGITANGGGYPSRSGPGAGSSLTSVAGGGGYGGLGGSDTPTSGRSYGSLSAPLEMGSGGGTANGAPATGSGAGGGIVRLSVTGTLTVDGAISANGRNGGQSGAGGAGGAVNIGAGTLTGSGRILANGGAGDPLSNAGGGAGGRIAIQVPTNHFQGALMASGGAGAQAGGAGTIYVRSGNQAVGVVTIDNAGQAGAATPVANIGVFDLTVSGGAIAYPSTSFLILSNLFVDSGGMMTSGSGQTNLQLSVLSNLVINPGSGVVVDGLGFAEALGPGAGQSASGLGSGAGYGGFGGDSQTAPGGVSYGSATEPADMGSGGGYGSGPLYAGGSTGGGAIRLDVGGNLTVDGWLSAEGYPGLQDNSGGGSGGSIWVNSRALYGSGYIIADGGEGELFGGGGGSGGRIALYHLRNNIHTNTFSGYLTAYGGQGDWWGDDGSIFLASTSGGLHVVGQTPVGSTAPAVSSMTVTFDGAVNPFSVSSSNAVLTTPGGVLPPGLLTFSAADPYTLRINFPEQTAPGLYTLNLGPQILDLFGQPMSQPYTGTFTIVLPTVSGTITDTNGAPVAGVLVQPDGGFVAATTDAQGRYALSFTPGASFTVTPSYTNHMFLPGSRSYVNLATSASDENYTMVATIAPYLQGGLQDGNLMLGWQGLTGVTYQVYSSTNLLDWVPYGSAISGTNAMMEIPLPIGADPNTFFRVQASN